MNGMDALPRALAQVREGLELGTHVGAQIYVSLRGETVAHAALGLARPGVPMSTATVVPWLSAGKPLTAALLGRLWERGLLDLDDPAALHVPEFGQGGKEGITLRHLLTHTSGFEVPGLDWVRLSWREVLETICRTPMPEGAVPGRKAAYGAQSGWFVLGEVARRVAAKAGLAAPGAGTDAGDPGQDFARLMRREIFEPVGMRDSWIGIPPEPYQALGDRIALFYETGVMVDEPRVAPWDTPERAAVVSPGGGARGPVRELGRFYEMLLRRGLNEEGRRVFGAPTVEALTARHRVDMTDETFRHKVDWGLGFLVESGRYGELVPYGYGRHASPRAFGHGGMQSTTGFADPEHGLVVVATFNGLPGEARHSRRVREFNTALYEDLGLAR